MAGAEEETFVCPTCHEEFPSWEVYDTTHRVIYLGKCKEAKESPKVRKFSERHQCPCCHKNFPSEYELWMHTDAGAAAEPIEGVEIHEEEVIVPVSSYKYRKYTKAWMREQMEPIWEQERLKHAAATVEKQLESITDPYKRRRRIQWAKSKGIPISVEF